MDCGVSTFGCVAQCVGVGQIAGDRFGAQQFKLLCGAVAACQGDDVVAVRTQRGDRCLPDVAGAAGDEDLHGVPLLISD
jgi:hypothetical protein